jgi:hypothetical protein
MQHQVPGQVGRKTRAFLTVVNFWLNSVHTFNPPHASAEGDGPGPLADVMLVGVKKDLIPENDLPAALDAINQLLVRDDWVVHTY